MRLILYLKRSIQKYNKNGILVYREVFYSRCIRLYLIYILIENIEKISDY